MRYLAILPLLIFLLSCGEEEKVPVYTIVEGQFPEGVEEIRSPGYVRRTIQLDEQGRFNDTLEINEPKYTSYYTNGSSAAVYIEPGSKVSFVISSAEETPAFSGQHIAANQYLAQKANTESTAIGDYRKVFSLEEDDFLALVDSTYGVISAQLAEITGEDNFTKLETEALTYDKLFGVAQYTVYHPRMVEDYAPSGKMEAMLADFDFSNETAAKTFEDYSGIASTILDAEIYADESEDINYLDRSLEIFQKVESPTLLHSLLNGTLYYFNSQSEDLEADRDRLLAMAKLDVTKDAVNERYELLNSLKAGQPSPTFAYENYKGGETKLEDLRGKYVYVDVWATWCGPCIGEIPSLKAMEEKFHNANVEFVSISIDEQDDYEKWRTMIEKRELGGTQLMSDNNWNSKFVTSYGIQGIPHFVLIDPEGNIVSADAPRPSDDALLDQFTELGIQP